MRHVLFTFLVLLAPISSSAGDWSGNISLQSRYFTSDPLVLNQQQHNNYFSLSGEPEYYTPLADHQSFTFSPFLRIDQYDEERTHFDIREAVWLGIFDGWEMKAGISSVFWGVTESQHLVDIVNQTDILENIDGEAKLGQPMVSVSIEKDWGLIDLYVLPYFRERPFPGIEGRPRSYPVVNGDAAVYESSDRQRHIDYAARLFSYLGDLELGISYFDGTSREPTFNYDPSTNRLIPFYRQMNQFGIDAQMTTTEWLWKVETIKRTWSDKDFLALTTGFEYTFVGVLESSADLGIVVEYLYDDRNELSPNAFEDDVLTGFRYTFNDARSTEALLGFIFDMDSQELFISFEGSRRLSQHWSMELEARMFQNVKPNSPLFMLRKDDFIQIDVSYYF